MNKRREFIKKTSKYAIGAGMSILMTPNVSTAGNYDKQAGNYGKQAPNNKPHCYPLSFKKCVKGHKYGWSKIRAWEKSK